MHDTFTLYTRKMSDGSIVYYCRFRDEDGRRLPGRSTGKTNEEDAKAWANRQVGKGITSGKKSLTFAAFTSDFWKWDKCEYIKRRLRRGHTIGRTHAATRRKHLELYLSPEFGKMKLAAIRPSNIESWIMRLADSGKHSSGTINHFLKNLSTILGEALRKDLIAANPCRKVEPLKATSRERGILTAAEIRLLFDEKGIPTIWKKDWRIYTINLVGAFTGLRMGEILGLQIQYVHPRYLEIVYSWEKRFSELKTTKTGKRRYIPLYSYVENWIQYCIENLRYRDPEDLVFCSLNKRGVPINAKTVYDCFVRAVHEIGITEAQRKARNIVFHSFRHMYNTFLLSSGVSPDRVRMLTGHSDARMTENYSHFQPDDFKDVLLAQEKLLLNGPESGE